MTNARPFLGTTTSRAEAFPGIRALTMTVSQDEYGFYSSGPAQRERGYNLSNIPRHERCINPRCQQGGLDLQSFVLNWGDMEDQQFFCNGHEGSPTGRHKGRPCDNRFRVTMKTERE